MSGSFKKKNSSMGGLVLAGIVSALALAPGVGENQPPRQGR